MLYAVILKAKPPFEQDQKVDLSVYSMGQSTFACDLDVIKADYIIFGKILRPYDMPLVLFGGISRWFLPFDNRGEWVLATLLERMK